MRMRRASFGRQIQNIKHGKNRKVCICTWNHPLCLSYICWCLEMVNVYDLIECHHTLIHSDTFKVKGEGQKAKRNSIDYRHTVLCSVNREEKMEFASRTQVVPMGDKSDIQIHINAHRCKHFALLWIVIVLSLSLSFHPYSQCVQRFLYCVWHLDSNPSMIFHLIICVWCSLCDSALSLSLSFCLRCSVSLSTNEIALLVNGHSMV